jgi:hypothetical protein
MALTPQQQALTWRAMLGQDGALSDAFTKPDLTAAVVAADAWATANAASYNAALSDPFKSNATAQQKALLLAYVCLKRAGL